MLQTSNTICLKPEGSGMKIKKFTFLWGTSICLFGALFFNNSLYAAGTQAGVDISNIAIVNYEIDGAVQSAIESSPTGNSSSGVGIGAATTFKVDRKIDLVVTGNNNAEVIPGDFQSEVTFTLTNEGNDIQGFQLTPNASLTGDNFDIASCTTTVTSVTGVALPDVTLPSTNAIKLSPDQSASISVKCDIPLFNGVTPIATGDVSLLSLNAEAKTNDDDSVVSQSIGIDIVDEVETVFADGIGTDDLGRDASHSARRTYTATLGSTPPTLSITKTLLKMKDPNGGNEAIAGSEVTYKIKIVTEGMGELTDVVITDITPAEMQYKPETILLENINLSDVSDADKGDFGVTTANTATINLGTITAGDDYEIQLTYIINE